MTRSQCILSFIPSLLGLLPPFFSPTCWDRFTWDGRYGGVPPARPPVSSQPSPTVDGSPCAVVLQETSVCRHKGTFLPPTPPRLCHAFPFYILLLGELSCPLEENSTSFALLPPSLSSHPVLPRWLCPRLARFASIIKHPKLRNLRNVSQMANASFFM